MVVIADISALELGDEPVSPELVLVTPELRALALRMLPPPVWSIPSTPSADHESALRTLVGTMEVTARVPVLLTLVVWAAIAIARTMLIVGGPVIVMVMLATLFGH